MATAQETFAKKNAGAAIFVREKADGIAMLAVSPCRLVFEIRGAIHSDHIVGVLADARAAGLLVSDAFSALVDMTGFIGAIDWKVIPKISEIMPKGDSVNKNAYIVRNTIFAMLAKITMVLFPQTQHRTFSTEAEARAWLGWE